MKETETFGRREFFRRAGKVVKGVVAAEVLLPACIAINPAVEIITNQPTGNAGLQKNLQTQIPKMCKDSPNPQECAKNPPLSTADIARHTVIAPIREELIFRAPFSVAVSLLDNQNKQKKHPVKDVLVGTGRFRMGRREFVAGLVSSIVFGLAHNITSTGFDTRTIPASQTFMGMALWYLQRTSGLTVSTITHMWFNFRALTKPTST